MTSGAKPASRNATTDARRNSSGSSAYRICIDRNVSVAALVVRTKIAAVVDTWVPSEASVTKPSFQAVRKFLCTSE